MYSPGYFHDNRNGEPHYNGYPPHGHSHSMPPRGHSPSGYAYHPNPHAYAPHACGPVHVHVHHRYNPPPGYIGQQANRSGPIQQRQLDYNSPPDHVRQVEYRPRSSGHRRRNRKVRLISDECSLDYRSTMRAEQMEPSAASSPPPRATQLQMELHQARRQVQTLRAD
ncbi:hypothetical protein IQ06DRAFT_89910 [Phaeosphaeriaceae sp. SRC1lsM3a]|nr:hypothetical protein IQ06DRAFT_89910 [Stagonospora sp. SRC1lsM3a]